MITPTSIKDLPDLNATYDPNHIKFTRLFQNWPVAPDEY